MSQADISSADTAAESWLKEPWSNAERERDASKFGIWVFLASEMLFFGALILTYTAYRIEDPFAFAAAGRETNVWFGTANTAVLLTSSLSMAMASQAAAFNEAPRRLIGWCLAATAALGLAFLVIKGFEYKEDLDKHLFPGASFPLAAPASQIFFALYWILTVVHAVHLSIGIGLVSRLSGSILLNRMEPARHPQIEVTALYWHLVDIIWIFLYPLIYLPGRAS
jgi:cytochrome c oxidase subunit 3